MSLFIDTLEDEEGRSYEYGHCHLDADEGREESGCGMEYAYYPATSTLLRWHDAVGQVTISGNFSEESRYLLECIHAEHMGGDHA
jgi:hypothetical protein